MAPVPRRKFQTSSNDTADTVCSEPCPHDRNDRGPYAATRSPSLRTLDEDSPWAKKNVLTLDGGGVRGFSALLILKELMAKIQRCEEEEDPEAKSSAQSPMIAASLTGYDQADPSESFLPCHYFDYMAGTSTGGLIAIMLGRLRVSVDTALDTYRQLSKTVFDKSSPLKRIFGAQDKMGRERALLTIMERIHPAQPSVDEKEAEFRSDPTRCRTVVYTLRSEIEGENIQKLYLFRSYSHAAKCNHLLERNPGEKQSPLIQDVARAASAGPIHSRPLPLGNSRFFDASAVLDNPSWEILQEVSQMHGGEVDATGLLLSIGCGKSKMKRWRRKNGEKNGVLRTSYPPLARRSRYMDDGIDPLKKQIISAAPELNYYRFSAGLRLHGIRSDEWKDGTEAMIKSVTKLHLKAVDGQLESCARMLVSCRRARARTLQWESYALGTRYWCPNEGCRYANGGTQHPFGNRNELLDHLQIEHELAPPDSQSYEKIKSLLDAGRTNSN